MKFRATRLLFFCVLASGCSPSSDSDDGALTRENEELRRQNETLKKRAQSPADLVARNEVLELQNAELSSQVTQVQGELSEKQTEVQTLSANLTALSQDIEAKKKRIEELARVLASNEGGLETLTAEHARLQDEVTRLETTRLELTNQLTQAQSSAAELSKKVTDMQQTLTTLQTEHARDTTALASVRDLSRAILQPYRGIWVAEPDEARALPEGCRLFLRVDQEPVGFLRVAICDDGRNQVDRFTLKGVDSRYHAESATNALRFRFSRAATSCASGPGSIAASEALYFLNFLDGWGEVTSPQTAVLGDGDTARYFTSGNQMPEFLRSASCPDIQARANAADAKPLLKAAAKACALTAETLGNGCIEIP